MTGGERNGYNDRVTMHSAPSTSTVRLLLLSLVVSGALLASPSSTALAGPVLLPRPVAKDANARLVNLSAETSVFYKGQPLRFTVLRAGAGSCAEVRVSLNGKSYVQKNATFPFTFAIAPGTHLYPSTRGKYEIVVEGVSGCTGSLKYVFAYNDSAEGAVTGVKTIGFESAATAAARIEGHGMCRLKVATFNAPYDRNTSSPGELVFFYDPVRLPLTVPLKRSGEIAAQWGGDYVLEITSLDTFVDGALDPATQKAHRGYEGCHVTAPGNAGGFRVQKTFSTQKASANKTGSSGTAPGGGGSVPAPKKAASGNITSMLVPGGSFAEDEAQKIQVNGQGGCGFDLTISNKSYGGSYEQAFPVTPMKLDGGAMLYNGTHFGTLAEGSWKASTAGKNGCTGTATVHFKVTPKTSTKKVLGQPTIAFDQQPKSGGVFKASKDGNIWFKVTVPQSVKDEPNATCCDVTYEYLNEYGGWQPLPSSPISDSSWALAPKQGSAVVPKSVSYFSNGMQWRMKVAASKFKTEFEWSDWIEFKVDQH